MTARVLMIQGTASDVGKSLVVAALCAYYRGQGLSVAPFKSQNMALNAAVTAQGHEIGRAQATQAAAAGVPAHVDMNPILLKPEGVDGCQVVAQGRVWGRLAAGEYKRRKSEFAAIVEGSLARLRARHDMVVIEGAGSPAEINLRDDEIVNMFVANLANAPVWLVGDIDRGGVFASLVGTLSLLEPAERARVKGLLINRFRGDLDLLRPGLPMLEERTGVPVLGVLPHLEDLRLPDEDSLALGTRVQRARHPERLDVCVIRLPFVSNFDDVLTLEHEPSVTVRFVDAGADVLAADLVILPGSKRTRADLAWLRQRGLAQALQARARQARPTLGICGGYQMLGQRIEDPAGVEGPPGGVDGLGLLPCVTRFEVDKVTRQVTARLASPHRLALAASDMALAGYEIHAGRVTRLPGAVPLLDLGGSRTEGCLDPNARVAGTLVHGLLDADAPRHALLAALWQARGRTPQDGDFPRYRHRPQEQFDRLADWIAQAVGPDNLAGPAPPR